MSYDNVPAIRKLYRREYTRVTFNLGYSAHDFRVGTELLIYDKSLYFPKAWRRHIPTAFITAAERLGLPMPT